MSHSLPKRVLYYGKDEPLPEQVPLRAGPWSMIFEAGDLRYVKLADREVIRRIYAAVRDRNWGTVLGHTENLKLDVREDSFHITYDSDHKEQEIHFAWHGEITGEADGTIRFMLDGEAKSTFLKNRIGFCVLHPIRECAGAPCQLEYADGAKKLAAFPELVTAEQPVADLHDLRAIAHEIVSGLWADVRFEGDLFEVEDQRNWIDASFKTFCTPLRLPFPVQITAGTKLKQSVTLKLIQMTDSRCPMPDFKICRGPENRASDLVNLEIRDQTVPLPSIGLGAPSHDRGYLERDVRRLSALRTSHLRVDLRINSGNWPGELWLAAGSADADVSLELALHFPNVSPAAMKDVASELEKRKQQLGRILVLQDGASSTPERLMKLARKHLACLDVPIGGGTDADFYQLNQFPPTAGICDFICWSMNPQVHAFDNTSLAETAEAIPAQIQTARARFPGKPLVVSPITLKPRFNPVATAEESGTSPGELPPQVDPRQMSLLGACWTLAAFKALAESGVDSVTFFETTGWRGVMETAAGSPLPGKFPSIPGGVFPLYHVLADIGEFRGGEVVVSSSTNPLAVQCLVLRKPTRTRILLANPTWKPQVAVIRRLTRTARLRLLDETDAVEAMSEPERYRAVRGKARKPVAGSLEVELQPCVLARIDVQA
jgi:hypothetical protein